MQPQFVGSLGVYLAEAPLFFGCCFCGWCAVVQVSAVCVALGPCSVESREQILEVAQAVREAGATALRGGAFKPRTSPYSFQGLKEKGLQLLAEARDATGLAIVTEVMAPEHVPMLAKYADVLQ